MEILWKHLVSFKDFKSSQAFYDTNFISEPTNYIKKTWGVFFLVTNKIEK